MGDARERQITGPEGHPSSALTDSESETSIKRVLDTLVRIAEGDLSFVTSATQNGFTSEQDLKLLLALDEMARRLRYIVGRLQRAADSIDTVVGEVLRGTQAVSAGVIDEGRSIEET